MRKTTLAYLFSCTLCLSSCTDSLCCKQERASATPMAKVYRHKYGQELSASDWEARGGFGTITTRLTNGVVRTENYDHRQLHGDLTETFPFSSNVARREVYDRGQKVQELQYAASGVPIQKQEWRGDQYSLTAWYADGSPLAVEVYEQNRLVSGHYYNAEHELEAQVSEGQGFRQCRNQQGQLLALEEIQAGEVRQRTELYANGQPRKVTPFMNSVVHGLVALYNPDGTPELTEEYRHGLRSGLLTTYLNGEVAREIPFVAGKKDGVERQYTDGKQVVRTVSWRDDMQHGPSETLLPEAHRLEYWYRGNLVPKFTYERQMSKERHNRPKPLQVKEELE